MSRFCSNLALPNMVQRAATHIARKAVELDIVPGRSPISVAAAAIYMASQVTKTFLITMLLRFYFICLHSNRKYSNAVCMKHDIKTFPFCHWRCVLKI